MAGLKDFIRDLSGEISFVDIFHILSKCLAGSQVSSTPSPQNDHLAWLELQACLLCTRTAMSATQHKTVDFLKIL